MTWILQYPDRARRATFKVCLACFILLSLTAADWFSWNIDWEIEETGPRLRPIVGALLTGAWPILGFATIITFWGALAQIFGACIFAYIEGGYTFEEAMAGVPYIKGKSLLRNYRILSEMAGEKSFPSFADITYGRTRDEDLKFYDPLPALASVESLIERLGEDKYQMKDKAKLVGDMKRLSDFLRYTAEKRKNFRFGFST
ncbi:hypothetical protein HYR69_08410 [Candidatus Sumerlaeota bacterium]|nr:hypothetical protein [Candidatus Sumerlaeota bacterium]MBI3734931.1 hypothetical protein [Candidatus Sumerlaeota bacterium]